MIILGNNNKIVKDDSNLEYVKCDLCNMNNYTLLFKSKDYIFNNAVGEFKIVKCLKCNLVFTNPRPKSNELKKYYSYNINYDNRPLDLKNKNEINLPLSKGLLTDYLNYPLLEKSKLRKLIEFPNYLRIRRNWIKTQVIPAYIKNGKVLEIGCSYGINLYLLKKLGWKVKGIELNEQAVDFAKKRLNIDVENINMHNFQTRDLFDIIILRMVLEHSESPKEILHKCYSWLKNNGKIIITVPDFSGIESRIYKKYAYTLQLPYHLYHFTPNTLKSYLMIFNFKKVKIIHLNRERDLISPLKLILKENPNNILLRSVLNLCYKNYFRNIVLKKFLYIFALFGITSRMTVIAIK